MQSYFDTLLRYTVTFCGAVVLKVMGQKTLVKRGWGYKVLLTVYLYTLGRHEFTNLWFILETLPDTLSFSFFQWRNLRTIFHICLAIPKIKPRVILSSQNREFTYLKGIYHFLVLSLFGHVVYCFACFSSITYAFLSAILNLKI